MRITFILDDEAMAEALEVSPGRTKTAVINDALRAFARRRRQRDLLELEVRAGWEGDLDDLRRRRGEDEA